MNDSANPGYQSSDGLHPNTALAQAVIRSPMNSTPGPREALPGGCEESPALKRRRQRIALIEEFGGHAADLKLVAVEAIKRGMYSPRTNRGDVELSLLRTWKLRKREYGR